MEIGLNNFLGFVQKNKKRIVILGDKHTLKDCFPLLEEDLPTIQVPYGENYKNLNTCEFIWKKLTELNAHRNTILLCLGGGVLCDMGSFAGACYQRGLEVALVPTSLLAMVDASVGGKNGVNFMGLKNYIGSFKEAHHTFICTEFLRTLPQKEFVNGYVEMLKHGLIADKSHYNRVKMLFLKDATALDEDLILASIRIKQNHVAKDFRDTGVRKRLNYGHTIGHAIESYSLATNDENQALSHGVSVGLGIIVESYISSLVNGLSTESLDEISIVLRKLLIQVEQDIPTFEDLWPYLIRDKKNDSTEINCSLLNDIGDCQEDNNIPVAVLKQGLDYLVRLK